MKEHETKLFIFLSDEFQIEMLSLLLQQRIAIDSLRIYPLHVKILFLLPIGEDKINSAKLQFSYKSLIG